MIEDIKPNEPIFWVVVKGVVGGAISVSMMLVLGEFATRLFSYQTRDNFPYNILYPIIAILISVWVTFGIIYWLKSHDTAKYNLIRYVVFLGTYLIAAVFWIVLELYIAVKFFDARLMTY